MARVNFIIINFQKYRYYYWNIFIRHLTNLINLHKQNIFDHYFFINSLCMDYYVFLNFKKIFQGFIIFKNILVNLLDL